MLTIVTEAPLRGRAQTVISRVMRKIDAEVQWVVLGDDIPVSDAVVAMSPWDNSVLREVTGSTVPINKARGYRLESDSGLVVPTFSPFDVALGKFHLIPILIWDISRALDEIGKPPPTWPLEQLTLYPTPGEFEEWLRIARDSEFLIHDIETAYSRQHDEDDEEQDSSYEITRVSLARSDGCAITFPYQEPFIKILKDFLHRSGIDRVGWNTDEFDDPREAYNGWPMGGRRVDARWLWHFLQPSLPQSLACVSTFYTRVPEWKSIGSSKGTDDELYSAMDAWATAQNYLGIVRALKNRRLK